MLIQDIIRKLFLLNLSVFSSDQVVLKLELASEWLFPVPYYLTQWL